MKDKILTANNIIKQAYFSCFIHVPFTGVKKVRKPKSKLDLVGSFGDGNKVLTYYDARFYIQLGNDFFKLV